MPYLNPAGIAGLPADVFALSANVYGVSRFRVEPLFVKEFNFPFEVDEDTQRGQTTYQLPSSIMYSKRLSRVDDPVQHYLAVSLIIPEATQIEINGRYRASLPTAFGADIDDRFFSYRYVDFNLGGSFATAIGERLRAGATLFGRYTESSWSLQSARTFHAFSGAIQRLESESSSGTTSSRSFWVKLGMQAEPTDQLWVGFGVSSPTFLHSGVERSASTSHTSLLDVTTRVSSSAEADYEDRLPWTLNAGLAWEAPKSFAISADVSATFAGDAIRSTGVDRFVINRTDEIVRDVSLAFEHTQERVATTNFALGGELFLADWLALRAGGYAVFSPYPEPNPQTDAAYNGTDDVFGVSAGFGLFLGPAETSMGVSYQRSVGKMTVDNAVPDPPSVLADYSVDTFFVMLAGAISVEEAKTQINDTLPAAAPGGPSLELP
jgi:hypothetical protein